MASAYWEGIPAYCRFRYFFEYRQEQCRCHGSLTCVFCVMHFHGKMARRGACCEYHEPRLNEYLKDCVSEGEKAGAIKQAREQLAVELRDEQVRQLKDGYRRAEEECWRWRQTNGGMNLDRGFWFSGQDRIGLDLTRER